MNNSDQVPLPLADPVGGRIGDLESEALANSRRLTVITFCYSRSVRIIARSTLLRYAKRAGRIDSAGSLTEWYRLASRAMWRTPNDVKSTLGNASIINHERVVFNIAGNKHRLIAAIDYQRQVLFVKFIGTHSEYDRVDAATVDAWE